MISIPPSKPNQWHKRYEWVKYANTLFRYFSRRSNYALRLELAKGMIASVDPRGRIVRLNPDFATAPMQYARVVRHSPTLMRDHIIFSMKGYLAHEAAHVRFSSEKPAHPMLGQIWNAIEDERIERLMSEAHPDLAGIFTHIGDIHLTRGWDELQFTPLEGVLIWRWAHDHPTLRWNCNDPETWARVLPHVLAAWSEPDPDMVEEHAKRILEELRLPEGAQAPDIMNGPLVTCPDPEPGKDQGKGKGKGKGQQPNQDDNDQQAGNGSGDQQDDDNQDNHDGQGGDEGEDSDENTNGAGQEAGDQEGEDADDPQAGSGNQDDSQDTASGEDDDSDSDGYGSYDEGAGTDGGAGGEGVGYPGYEPAAPEIVPEDPNHIRAREILQDVEGHSRDLAQALALPDAPNLRVSHESRGRFDYGRYATNAQRQFRFKNHKGKKVMPRITLLHDNSGSMGFHRPGDAQYHAVRATMMLQRACELSRTPLNVIAFNHRHHLVTRAVDDPEKARGNIGGIRSTGSTSLAPALRTALTLKHPSRHRHVVVIYCDGHIDHRDAHQCRELAKNNPDTFILPILIGSSTNPTQFNAAFGRALEIKNADELATKLKSWVSANLHT